ncbi:FAD-dependent oxidoreductase [Fluviibacterium sp. DFM31]|uniref:FAD-dependent oxidoreductase n=1 Tax=Meridianimarinicoccus marinus TaxID=3231483 RepID=A0ABV3L9N3_9RHOB
MRRVGIIGAGLAGMACARQLRDQGFDGEICVFNGEPDAPYEKPGLSKGRIGCDLPTAIPLPEVTMTGAALSVDAGARRIDSVSGPSAPFDAILLAPGRVPVLVPGLEGALTCRTRADVRALRARLTPKAQVVIVGAGLIGMELAAALAPEVAQVTVVEAGSRAMARVVPEAIAAVMVARLEAAGVALRFGETLDSLSDGQGGMRSGARLPADIVILAIGAAPDLRLARAAGLVTRREGIVVGPDMRASAAGILAAGDAACVEDRGQVLACQNYAAARAMGIAAAETMLGRPSRWKPDSWFWSDQGDVTLEGVGSPEGQAEVTTHPDGGLSVAVTQADRLVGQFAAGSRKALRSVRKARATLDAPLPEGAPA